MPLPARRPASTLRHWLQLHPLHARHKFVLLGVIGMLMVATPLVDVVRRQTQELQNLLGAAPGLDPMTRAVDVQRSLIAHRGTAALVLGGREELEAERQTRQGEVDRRMATLTATLVQGRHGPALDEDAGLRADWATLVERIAARHIGADASNAAHRLLIEQVLQVMDLVADAGGARAGTGLTSAWREPRHTMRLALAFAELESARQQATQADQSVQADLGAARRQLQSAARTAAAAADDPGPSAAGAALRQARAQAHHALRSYLAALEAADDAQAQRAAALLSDALAAWPVRALAALEATLAGRAEAVARERAVLLGLMLLLAALQCVLVVSLWPRLAGSAGAAGGHGGLADPSERSGAESRQPAERLMHRLRDASHEAEQEAPPSQL